MNISFTLNQLQKFGMASVRAWDTIDSLREYFDIPVGTKLDSVNAHDYLSFLAGELREKSLASVHLSQPFSRRYNNISDVEAAMDELDVLFRLEVLERALHALVPHGNSGMSRSQDFSSVRQARKDFVLALDKVEW